jgi:hypothetical protein
LLTRKLRSDPKKNTGQRQREDEYIHICCLLAFNDSGADYITLEYETGLVFIKSFRTLRFELINNLNRGWNSDHQVGSAAMILSP